MPEIIVKLGDSIVQKYFFVQDRLQIGRASDNEIVIENLAVSRLHAVIERQGERYLIEDNGSSNGTYVNGVRVSKGELVDRDVIQIGKHELYFYDARAVAPRHSMTCDDERTMLVSEPASPAELAVVKGRHEGERFKLVAAVTVIGRDPDCDIRLSDWFVSRRHAEITRRGDKYAIRDLGAWRHVHVNGEPVKDTLLHDGDLIQLGPVQLEFTHALPMDQTPLRRAPRELEGFDERPRPSRRATADPNATLSDHYAEDDFPMPASSSPHDSGEDRLPAAEDDFDPPAADDEFEPQRHDEDRVAREVVEDLAIVSLQVAAEQTGLSMAEQRGLAAPAAAPAAQDEKLAEEIEMWEKALTNKSLAIRKQAARRLKQLTGRDYEHQ